VAFDSTEIVRVWVLNLIYRLLVLSISDLVVKHGVRGINWPFADAYQLEI
jgi:hypothetical protein